MEKKKKLIKQKTIITPEKMEEEIRERARQIFLELGNTQGDATSDWLQAEREIKKKYNLTFCSV